MGIFTSCGCVKYIHDGIGKFASDSIGSLASLSINIFKLIQNSLMQIFRLARHVFKFKICWPDRRSTATTQQLPEAEPLFKSSATNISSAYTFAAGGPGRGDRSAYTLAGEVSNPRGPGRGDRRPVTHRQQPLLAVALPSIPIGCRPVPGALTALPHEPRIFLPETIVHLGTLQRRPTPAACEEVYGCFFVHVTKLPGIFFLVDLNQVLVSRCV